MTTTDTQTNRQTDTWTFRAAERLNIVAVEFLAEVSVVVVIAAKFRFAYFAVPRGKLRQLFRSLFWMQGSQRLAARSFPFIMWLATHFT